MTQIHLTATICRERGAAGSSAQLSSGNHNLVECHNSPDNYDLHKFHTKKKMELQSQAYTQTAPETYQRDRSH